MQVESFKLQMNMWIQIDGFELQVSIWTQVDGFKLEVSIWMQVDSFELDWLILLSRYLKSYSNSSSFLNHRTKKNEISCCTI